MFDTRHFAFAFVTAFAATGAAYAQGAPSLAIDTPTTIGATEAVCTGIGSDAREDPRWAAYPLRIEMAGAGGVFLGDALVKVAKMGEEGVSLHCAGPWVLLKLAPGAYRVTAEVEGNSVSANAAVPAKGQGRVMLRFPNISGAISKEHTLGAD